MADRLIELTREIYDAFNAGNFDSVLAHADPDFEVHDRDRTGLVHKGHDGWRDFIREWMEGWETYKVEVLEAERKGDNVFVHLLQSGVGRASGVEFSEPFSQVLTFRDEKVVRFAIFIDRDDAERAAGLRN